MDYCHAKIFGDSLQCHLRPCIYLHIPFSFIPLIFASLAFLARVILYSVSRKGAQRTQKESTGRLLKAVDETLDVSFEAFATEVDQ